MPEITEQEKQRRRESNADVLGTSAMEGLSPDAETLALMRRFEEGQLDRERLSAAIDKHVAELLAARTNLVGAA